MNSLHTKFFVHAFVYKINARFIPSLHQKNAGLIIDPRFRLETKLDRIHRLYLHLSVKGACQFVDCYDYAVTNTWISSDYYTFTVYK